MPYGRAPGRRGSRSGSGPTEGASTTASPAEDAIHRCRLHAFVG